MTLHTGATCAVHEGTSATAICARCGNFICALCLDSEDDGRCAACRSRAGNERITWERDAPGWPQRWGLTVASVLLRPYATFERVSPGELNRAFGFCALTLGVSSVLFGVVFLGEIALYLLLGGDSLRAAGVAVGRLDTTLGVLLGALMMMVFGWLGQLLLVVVRGLVIYLASMLLGGGRDAAVPFWTVSYFSAAHLVYGLVALLQIVPVIGPLLWGLAVLAVEVWVALALTRASESLLGHSGTRATLVGWSGFLLVFALGASCCVLGALVGVIGA